MKKNVSHKISQQLGRTLLEVLLMLVIASSVLYVSIRQVRVYQDAGYAAELQANVDMLFQAMAAFHRANCYGSYNPITRTMSYGLLNPNAASPPPSPYILDISGQLLPYMTSTLDENPFVWNTTVSSIYQGYLAQFTQYTYPATVCVTGTSATGPYSAGCSATSQKGTVVIWRAQIAALLQSTTKAQQIKNMTGATCLSNGQGLGSGAPCASSTGTGSYLVWERQSTNANPLAALPPTWQNNAVVSQFTQMYQENSIDYLLSVSHSPETQYYTCGG